MTALMWATPYGHGSCVRFLFPLSKPLVQKKNGWTALMFAAYFRHLSCIESLLLVTDGQNEKGMTVLMLAAWMENEACVKLLLLLSDVLGMNDSSNGHTA